MKDINAYIAEKRMPRTMLLEGYDKNQCLVYYHDVQTDKWEVHILTVSEFPAEVQSTVKRLYHGESCEADFTLPDLGIENENIKLLKL